MKKLCLVSLVVAGVALMLALQVDAQQPAGGRPVGQNPGGVESRVGSISVGGLVAPFSSGTIDPAAIRPD